MSALDDKISIVEIGMLIIAVATLAILVWQEVRRRRELPRVALDVNRVAESFEQDETMWKVIELTNHGQAAATRLRVSVVDLEALQSGPREVMAELRPKSTLLPGDSMRFAVKGDISAGWLHIFYTNGTTGKLVVSWCPADPDGRAADVLSDQLSRQMSERSAIRRPWKWRRGTFTKFRALGPVGPYENGRSHALLATRRAKKSVELVSGVDAVYLLRDLED